jgi:hypothetical protein
MIRVPLFLLAVLCSGALTSGCKTGTTEAKYDDCGPSKAVFKYGTVHDVQGEYAFLETPEARNDCEAHYIFVFRWADPNYQVFRVTEQPPLNLPHAFEPGGELAYFPHPDPTYDPDFLVLDENNKQIGGKGWWKIDFSIGNKNSGNPTTRYTSSAYLDYSKASDDDSVQYVMKIFYYDKAKSN